jgi:membrane protease YdiL (CAAX protease family)
VLLLCRRSFEAYGLGLRRWSYHLNLGLVCSLLFIAIAALGLIVTRVHIDPSSPPDPHSPLELTRVVGLAVVALPAFFTMLVLLRTRGRIIERIPPAVTVAAIFALLAVLPLVAAHFQRPPMWLAALWLFFGAGFGEEIFYRGYIQSRMDQAFGRPFRLLGFEFGPGLFVSSLLFGFVHALNTVDYFNGRFDFGWGYGLQAFVEGLFLGCIRAKTGSVLPGAVMHGLGDAFARIPNLLP